MTAFLIGLTGNIACGKSTVGAYLRDRYAVDYVDADRVVHELYESGTPETAAIATAFGEHLLGPDGTIDRRRLGEIVMADPKERVRLEQLLQPAIRRRLTDRVTSSEAPVVVLDAIRLIEAGYAATCQSVWVVTCNRADQIARLESDRGFTREQAVLRVDAQASQAAKAAQADCVIENDGTLDSLLIQVDAAWERMIAPALA